MSEAERVIVPIPSLETPSSGEDNQRAVSAESARVVDWIEEIAERVVNHECILFLGSAIHVPAPRDSKYHYPKEKCPPIGSELSKLLAENCGFKGEDWWNLQRVSQYYEWKKRFRQLLVGAVTTAIHTGKEASPILHALADLDFPIVITTNYDKLYEQALDQKAASQAQGQASTYDLSIYSPSIYNPNDKSRVKTLDCSENPNPQRPYILKIHGDINKPESIVITEEDYIQFVLRMSDKHPYHPVGKNVLTYLNKWTTLFIGYRLTDYNLRLLFKTLRWRMDAAQIPPTYAVDIDPDKPIRDVWENKRGYVTFIVEDLWDFVPRLYKSVKRKEMPQCQTPSTVPSTAMK